MHILFKLVIFHCHVSFQGCIYRWNNPLLLGIDPNQPVFRDIQVGWRFKQAKISHDLERVSPSRSWDFSVNNDCWWLISPAGKTSFLGTVFGWWNFGVSWSNLTIILFKWVGSTTSKGSLSTIIYKVFQHHPSSESPQKPTGNEDILNLEAKTGNQR